MPMPTPATDASETSDANPMRAEQRVASRVAAAADKGIEFALFAPYNEIVELVGDFRTGNRCRW